MSQASESTNDDLEHLLGQTLAGFRLTHLLGAGASAVVFRGANVLEPKLVRSIKVLRPDAAASSVRRARFVEEAAVLSRIEHAHVVRCHGLCEGRVDGQDYLLMELDFLEGQSLGTLVLRSGDALAPTDVVRWLLEASRGIAAAHELGFVHGDLRPDNVFLTRSGAVKVLDFGMPRSVDVGATDGRIGKPGQAAGSVAYFAPEVCEGGTPSLASDVYALGITLAELLLGHHPFDPPGAKPRTGPRMAFAHLHESLPRISASRPEIPEALSAVVEKAASKRPRDRYADASELVRALAAVDVQGAARPADRPVVRTELVMPKMRSTFPPPESGARPRASTGRRLALFAAIVLAFSSLVFFLLRAHCSPLPGRSRVDAHATGSNPDAGALPR